MKILGVMQAKFADGEPTSLSQLFDGFHTITSLEKDVFVVTNLATPNFSTYNENENETGTIEDEMEPVKEKMQTAENNHVFGSDTNILKDRRTSLWELFQKTKNTEEKTQPIMKKILKRRMIQSSSKRCTVGAINSGSTDEKLHKILHRVHPEALAISQKSQNLWKYVMKSNCTNKGYTNRNQMLSEDIIIFPYRSISEKSENHTQSTYGAVDTNWKKECWIKSDAEYLILEL